MNSLVCSRSCRRRVLVSMATECPSKQACDTSGMAMKSPLDVNNKGDGNSIVSTTPSRKPVNPNKVLKRKNTPASLPTVRKLSGE